MTKKPQKQNNKKHTASNCVLQLELVPEAENMISLSY